MVLIRAARPRHGQQAEQGSQRQLLLGEQAGDQPPDQAERKGQEGDRGQSPALERRLEQQERGHRRGDGEADRPVETDLLGGAVLQNLRVVRQGEILAGQPLLEVSRDLAHAPTVHTGDDVQAPGDRIAVDDRGGLDRSYLRHIAEPEVAPARAVDQQVL